MKWYDVNRKLPKIFEEVIVYTGLEDGSMDRTLKIAYRVETRCGGWIWNFEKEKTNKVFYWHPLPELPTE